MPVKWVKKVKYIKKTEHDKTSQDNTGYYNTYFTGL